MDRVDSMTKVPPPDNNGRRVGVSVCIISYVCLAPERPEPSVNLSFPFRVFKGPLPRRLDSQTATEENGHLAQGLEFSRSLCHPLLKLMKMCAHVFSVLQGHAKTIPAHLNFLARLVHKNRS